MLAGCYALTLLERLPDERLLVVPIVAMLATLPDRRLRPVAAFALGFVLLWTASRNELAGRLASEMAGEVFVIEATIADFPLVSGDVARFVVHQSKHTELPRRMRLSWYGAPATLDIGDAWRLQVRLRRPRGFANPGGFDYEAWLFRQRIGATGYVVGGEEANRLRSTGSDTVTALRRGFVRRVQRLLPDDPATAVLVAVTVGARHLISREQWDRYAATGTSHLVAISGLHIGLAAGGAFVLSQVFVGPAVRRRNARCIGMMLAIVVAAMYAEISGLAVPAKRAMLMALLAATAVFLRRPPAASLVLACACMAIVATDPISVLAPGFQLSFGAVAILLWVAQQHVAPGSTPRGRRVGRVLNATRRLWALQLSLLFGLFSLTVFNFGRSAWLAPLVNLLALPVFSVIAVPAGLAGLFLDGPLQPIGDLFLRLAHQSICFIDGLLTVIADWPPALVRIRSLAGPAILVAMLPLARAVLPAGWPGRDIAVLAIVATVLHRPQPPPPACLDLLVLDVGQGLSAILRTHRRTVLYDSGPAFRGGSDVADFVIVPLLHRLGIDRLDLLLVSHADQDHAGGVATLEARVPIVALMTGERLPDSALPQTHCRAGDSWSWDGVTFDVLHPTVRGSWHGNNASCVVSVTLGEHRLLLTGDIERAVERDLLRQNALEESEVVLVPHHGSRTSSSAAFVNRLQPRVAIVSAGFGNRWGFPKDDVVRRWERVGAAVANTATSGAIANRYCAETPAGAVVEQRRSRRRYWHDD